MTTHIHGEKLKALLKNNKLSKDDVNRVKSAISEYENWIVELESVNATTLNELIDKMVELLNSYKNYIDIDLIFDNPEDFLYRQKGQLKLDNSIIEEFLPILISKCIEFEIGDYDISISSQVPIYSSIYFASGINSTADARGIRVKTKNQDFSMSKSLYLKASNSNNFIDKETVNLKLNLRYIVAELKTNLDKTMFQEAAATAREVKLSVTGARYYLLCDYLDMVPINTSTTDIDEVLILRKSRRINANKRREFNTYAGRQANREWYIDYLLENPYSSKVFKRFVHHILSQLKNEPLIEEDVLNLGFF